MKLEMPPFHQANVLVIGDVMLDRYWHGSTSRISPEAPVPVVKVGQTEDRAGGAANVALNIAALGAQVSLSGIVGNDSNAKALLQRLDAASIGCDFAVSEAAPTITKLRIISRHQQLIRMDFEESFSGDESEQLNQKALALLGQCKAVILSDYAKGALQNPQPIIQAAKQKQIPVFIDPKGSDYSAYRGATLLTPNLHEFETLVGACPSEQILVEKGLKLIRELELQALLITRGEHGMTLLRENEDELHLPARAMEVFDVTGAGDTVISVLASAVAAGQSLPQAVSLANLAAGIVVGKLGTATVSIPELTKAVLGEKVSQRGVMTEEQLLIAVEDARKQGEKIVFTNGCFDLLHVGHAAYLEDARRQGDRLIVAVNSDNSVKKLKGPGRPIVTAEDRMTMLSKLQAVDWVVVFEDDTPERLLQLLKPDILVKGGDYSVEGVVGADIVHSYGGEVKVLTLVDNRSTTAIVEKIQSEK